jgi:hypothetical protein
MAIQIRGVQIQNDSVGPTQIHIKQTRLKTRVKQRS